jgi:hypothetical protein
MIEETGKARGASLLGIIILCPTGGTPVKVSLKGIYKCCFLDVNTPAEGGGHVNCNEVFEILVVLKYLYVI